MENFEELLEEYLPEEKKKGNTVVATLIRKERDNGYLDLNSKLEGIIPLYEVENLNVGSIFDVKVIGKDENFIKVSKFALERENEFKNIQLGDIYESKVLKKIRGGYIVTVDKNKGFLPFKEIMARKEDDIVGETYTLIVIEKNDKDIVLSRKELMTKEELDFYSTLNVGDVLEGKVKEILDFALIIDLGKTTGFIHMSEVDWEKIEDLSSRYNVGDIVKSKIIELNKEKRKLKLSIKDLEENPWDIFIKNHNVGDRVKTRIEEIFNFGLVTNFGKGVSGLVHMSELSWSKRIRPSNYSEGEEIDAKIINIDNDKKRIGLSIKQLSQDPWEKIEESYNVGDVLEGTVLGIQDFGIFVEVQEGLDVFIHVSDYSWEHEDTDINFKKGDKVKFKLIELNKKEKKLKGGIKQLTISPWKELLNKYKVGNRIKTKVLLIEEKSIKVELTERFQGIILEKDSGKSNVKEFNVGDEIEAVIIRFDERRKEALLSIKRLMDKEEREELDELLKIYGV